MKKIQKMHIKKYIFRRNPKNNRSGKKDVGTPIKWKEIG
jgi:hypothetical protein